MVKPPPVSYLYEIPEPDWYDRIKLDLGLDLVSQYINRDQTVDSGLDSAAIVRAHLRGLETIVGSGMHQGGDRWCAGSRADELRTKYAATSRAREALPILFMIAIEKRDSASISTLLSDMHSAGFSSHELHMARSMKRGYERVYPRALMAKHSAWRDAPSPETESQGQSTLEDRIQLRNIPNPFGSATEIRYFLPEDGHVQLKVYNTLGQEIATLVNTPQASGVHFAYYEPGSAARSGVYYAILRTDYGTKSTRMIFTR